MKMNVIRNMKISSISPRFYYMDSVIPYLTDKFRSRREKQSDKLCYVVSNSIISSTPFSYLKFKFEHEKNQRSFS